MGYEWAGRMGWGDEGRSSVDTRSVPKLYCHDYTATAINIVCEQCMANYCVLTESHLPQCLLHPHLVPASVDLSVRSNSRNFDCPLASSHLEGRHHHVDSHSVSLHHQEPGLLLATQPAQQQGIHSKPILMASSVIKNEFWCVLSPWMKLVNPHCTCSYSVHVQQG